MIDEVVASLRDFDTVKTKNYVRNSPLASKKRFEEKKRKRKLIEFQNQPLNTTSNSLKKALNDSLVMNNVRIKNSKAFVKRNKPVIAFASRSSLLDMCNTESDDLSKYVSFSLQKQLQKGHFEKIRNKISKSPGLKTNKKGRKKYERARNYHNRKKSKSQRQRAKARRIKHFG